MRNVIRYVLASYNEDKSFKSVMKKEINWSFFFLNKVKRLNIIKKSWKDDKVWFLQNSCNSHHALRYLFTNVALHSEIFY